MGKQHIHGEEVVGWANWGTGPVGMWVDLEQDWWRAGQVRNCLCRELELLTGWELSQN